MFLMYIIRSIFLLHVTSYASAIRLRSARPARHRPEINVAQEISERLFRYRLLSAPPNATKVVDEPLLLTPFIDAGNLSEAKNVSRVPPLVDHIESYSGFFTVNRTARSHLHFWFFPRTIDRSRTAVPLILCLRGIEVLFTVFTENGPFRIKKGLLQKRKDIEYAWTNNYNVLYMDARIGVGYSFTEHGGFARSPFDVGRYIYEALLQFYKLFPEFGESDFYITGDAGTFVSAVACKIHTANGQPNAFKIPLKGIAIGGGKSNWREIEFLHPTYLQTIGLIDKHERLQLERMLDDLNPKNTKPQKIQEYIAQLRPMIAEFCGPYDYTRDMSMFVTLVSAYTKVVTQNKLRKSIHVGSVELNSDLNGTKEAWCDNCGRSVKSMIEELLEGQYKVLFYNGQHDHSSPHIANRNFLRGLRWFGASEFNRTRKQIWIVQGGNSVAGYYTKAQNLAYVMVRNAGHLVSSNQPAHAKSIIDSFIGERWETKDEWTPWLGEYLV